jgi:propionyl-CoA carboxylase alpha chain
VDDGFEEGMDIPIYYDPMIAKLVTYGKDREEARQRMLRAIDEYEISGVKTTLGFCRFALDHESFVSGNFDTNFVKQYFKPEYLEKVDAEEAKIAALLAAKLVEEKAKSTASNSPSEKRSSWKANRMN